MNKTLITILAVMGVLTLGFAIFFAGAMLGRYGWSSPMELMNNFGKPYFARLNPNVSCSFNRVGYGMMGNNRTGYGMMGNNGIGYGMMGGYPSIAGVNVEPLAITEVEKAVHVYLERFKNDDLVLGEIMIFDNHGYAQIVEASTGIGAMEVLVDPISFAVYPEHGPNMMWNLKYGMMGGFGRMGMSNGNFGTYDAEDMPISAEEAIESAQKYLDKNIPATQADDHADPFYGYYTIHVLREGEVLGMLSVNGFSGDVYLHTWHGDFIEMSEDH